MTGLCRARAARRNRQGRGYQRRLATPPEWHNKGTGNGPFIVPSKRQQEGFQRGQSHVGLTPRTFPFTRALPHLHKQQSPNLPPENDLSRVQPLAEVAILSPEENFPAHLQQWHPRKDFTKRTESVLPDQTESLLTKAPKLRFRKIRSCFNKKQDLFNVP